MLEISPKSRFEDWLYEQTGGVVQSGPFKEMKMLRELSWPDGALGPMLLGCHEQELHGPLEEEITRLADMEGDPLILNVGCAEGYYAVGLKRRLPLAKVWATDIYPEALRITAATAALNDVELVIERDPREALEAGPHLIVMDCEGAELEYLNPYTFPRLREAHIIVEIHQSKERDTGNLLVEHWKPSHHIVCYWEGGRNPNEFEMLRNRASLVRWMSVCENRPCQMAWFVMRPK
jgi:hypothetical protein